MLSFSSSQLHKADTKSNERSHRSWNDSTMKLSCLILIFRWIFQLKSINESLTLNHTTDQLVLNGFYRLFHPTDREYIFLNSPWKHYVIGEKAWHITNKKLIPCILSDHRGIKLVINRKSNPQKICKYLEMKLYNFVCTVCHWKYGEWI